MIACSIDLMPTGSSLTLSTHAASQGAGQMRPVNSGKLLVESSTAKAFCQSLPVHQVVEVRNDVVDRAAAVAERRAAVHAARALDLGLLVSEADDEFLVVLHALRHRAVALLDALVFHEAGDFSHGSVSPFVVCFGQPRRRVVLHRDMRVVARAGGFHLALVHLGQRALVFVREHLDELRARTRPVVQQFAGAPAAGPAVVLLQQLLAAAFRRPGPCAAASCRRPSARPRCPRAPATPSACCSGWRTGRPRRTRRRCRRTCRPRNCGRSCPAPAPCRRSCIRSRGRRCLRPPPWRPTGAPRSARRRRR